MKKLTTLLLFTVMLLSFFGCNKEPEFDQPVSFYYLASNLTYDAACTTVLPETREGAGLQSTQEFLNLYFAGPTAASLVSPFPDGLSLVACQLEGQILYLTVSDELATLSGTDLTLACCCLTLTCLSITSADTVCIQAENTLLGGQKTITMDRETLLLLDTSNQNSK